VVSESITTEHFSVDHPAVQAIRDRIEAYEDAYEQVAGDLATQEEELEAATTALREIQSHVERTRVALRENDRQQKALRDAIEHLTGARPATFQPNIYNTPCDNCGKILGEHTANGDRAHCPGHLYTFFYVTTLDPKASGKVPQA
jgi:DNA repair exonuclease SbcCD ATPase subunit